MGKVIGSVVFVALLNSACSVFGIRREEQPDYTVLLKDGDIEIRQYPSSVVAKTRVKGNFEEAQGRAFRILAGYIFGKNEQRQDIAMTAPVLQKNTESTSQTIAMTAPVLQASTSEGWEMSFIMPSKYRMEDLPVPKDARVTFAVIEPRTLAAIRYSGLARLKKNQEKAKELKDWVAQRGGLQIASESTYAGYDPPWTLSFFRRNEVLIEVNGTIEGVLESRNHQE